MAEVIVMHHTPVTLGTAEEPGPKPPRWRGVISDEEYTIATEADKAAGRLPRLERIDKPAGKSAKESAEIAGKSAGVENKGEIPFKKKRGRPRKAAE